MTWWQNNKLRLIQNNLRESDANLNVDQLIRELQKFDANVLMMNAGGIVAFYPSELEHQYISSSLDKDLLGESVEKVHAAGMHFIARFDFSKAHESIFAKHPEWFYRTKAGDAVNYHGIMHTCLNSYYQQKYSLLMIDEVLSKYPVDGVFFNMFGYKTQDYSGREYGLCYCDNCSKRFMGMYGLTLPEQANDSDPHYAAYKQFQEKTTRDMLDVIHAFVKAKNPDVAISTYHHHKVDIIRKESNTALTRSHPVWLYSASENVMSVENSWDDKLVSNCSINAIDLQYRFTGVSKYESQIRLYENIAAGSGLDFCIIGQFTDYTDRGNFASVQEVFRFHRANEQYFGELQPMSDVVLIRPNGFNKSAMREYLGVFKMLKEQHIMFTAVEQDAFATAFDMNDFDTFRDIRALIIPGLPSMEPNQIALLAQLREAGVHLIATGHALSDSPDELLRLFNARYEGMIDQTDAAYVQINDRELFPSFPERDWLIVNGTFGYVTYAESDSSTLQSHLPFIAPSTFGPPERAYGHKITSYAGVGIIDHMDGGGRTLYYPWSIGELFYKHGYEDHKLVLTDVLDGLIRLRLMTDAPPSVELYLNRLSDGSTIVQLINLSGFNGVSYHKPLPIRDIQISIRGLKRGQVSVHSSTQELKPTIEAKLLHAGIPIDISIDEKGDASLSLDVLEQYEAIVIVG